LHLRKYCTKEQKDEKIDIGKVNDFEPTGAAVKKPHLFLTDENAASSATLQVLGEVM
jgi:hypothetical protein